MASAVDISNTALSHLGADAVVTSLSPPDGSVEAGHCARFLPIARQAALVTHNWNFARKRVALALLTNDSAEWAYKYQLPSDCLRARKILSLDDMDMPERNGALFDIEGDAIYTNQEIATLVYTTDVTDTTKYPPDFVQGLGMLLAGYLAGPLIKGSEGMKISDAWIERGLAIMRRVAAFDASSAKENSEFTPGSIAVRA